jgi:hypothetical protein
VVVASSFAVVRRSNELLPDAPAAVLVLAFAGVLIGGLGPGADPNRRWRLVWLGPLAAAAFYVRYGSLGIVGALALAAAIVWRRRLRDNAGPLAAAVVVAAACAVPHVVHSLIATGRPFGILAQASFAAGRAYTGDGLVFYASAWWLWLGPLAAVCALAGLVAAAARRDEVTAFAGLASVLALVALGLDAHGEARFVLVPEVLLVAAGTDAIIARAFPRPKLAAALCAIAFVGAAAATEVGLARERRTFGVAVRAAEVVRGAAGGAPCAVIAGKWTQLEWYSGCAGAVVSDEAIAPAAVAGRAVFLVWYENGVRQPAEVLADLRARRRGVGAAEVARVPGDGGLWGAATVYRLSIGP